MVLPDLLKPGLDVVFCGTAAGAVSAERGAYYAHPGNKFWSILHDTGLTTRRLKPEEYPLLLRDRIGLTDMNKTQSGNDVDLTPDGFDRSTLEQKIRFHKPRILAFTSKRAGREFLGLKSHEPLDYGLQEARIGDTQIYVLPSTSGAASANWDASHWHAMAQSAVNQTHQR